MLKIDDIMKTCQHRSPFILIDGITELVLGEKAIGYKNITANEEWSMGHFPDNPIFPGIFIIEMMAQISGFILGAYEADEKKSPIEFFGVDKIRFLRKALPGDRIFVESRMLTSDSSFCRFKCEAKVDDEYVATGIIMLHQEIFKY